MKKYLVACVVSALLLLGGLPVTAEESVHKEQVLSLVQEALNDQGSLSEEIRTKKEIKEKLNKHFTDEFAEKFIQANVTKVEEGYMALGSDFAPYYIPFFSYDDHTEVIYGKDSNYIYVQETFEASEDGPVTSGKQVEVVTLKKEKNVWKITDVSYVSEKQKTAGNK
ncbi:DUF3993 domain-containing protein [Peribacillus sp. NPDC097675]|uniref:DUF3993 domain-containing protein n=1 Tax=Peribacillus sp. NPDC097675 TaxID=3390618 RepID=UPI003D07F509